jgi:type I restriction-modification system DNA methylase subunit
MSKVWLCETDMEVADFHPVCERALNEALASLDLDNKYKTEHHRYVGSLEMDLVITNKVTNKIFCVVEVKRTIPAVYSSRYQYQAMNYVQSLRDAEKETNYYILTNLECSCLFLYSSQRQNVYDQLIQPGYVFNHRFEDVSEDIFRRDLALHYKSLLQRILNQNTNYLLSFSNFASIVRESMPSLLRWNSSLVFMFYEYIRGSFNEIGRRDLYDIKQFRNDINAICREASRVNFKGIFGFDSNEYDATYKPAEVILGDLYKLGQNYKDAELICNVMHQVISSGHTHEGEVPTDIELAQTLISIVKTFKPSISAGHNITDPAAGSGTLLSAASSAYPDIQPSQIQANDINERLLQLLSLRIGLNFVSTVKISNSPVIKTQDISKLDVSFFENTEVIVLNPPYLSAVAEGCQRRKSALAARIKELTGYNSITNIGQAPLECPFIELVTDLVKPGTLIACIIPNTHISALGQSEVEFRKFLLDQFGLCMIFNYPQTNLFEEVIQNTSIFIGKAFQPQENIKFVQSLSIVSDIKQNTIEEAIQNIQEGEETKELVDGLVGYLVPRKLLYEKVCDGWKFLDSVMGDVHSYVNEHIINNTNLFCNIESAGYGDMYRGRVGNSGGSDLLYITTKPSFIQECCNEIKHSLKPGLRNSDYNSFDVGFGDHQFFDISNLDPSMVKDTIQLYLTKYETQQKQSQKKKSVDEWYNILKKETKHSVPVNSVLLPRGTRRFASTYITTKKTYLSTNFVAIETSSYSEAKILASWMCTVFYQLQLETTCKNQSGMRKLEVENITKTFVPKISSMSPVDIERICNTEITDFYDLKNPSIRRIDIEWAKVITQNEDVEGLLDEAIRYLTILAKNRES